MDNIRVSIICNTYNHEKYIESALKGFIMQKTNFPFEVLVHDDASTDKTADIIRLYENQYPDIIKPIYQNENQFSQGIYATDTFQMPRAKGDYIAFCEGDDCWIDENKLQKQFDLMESHPETGICAHAANNEQNGEYVGKTMPYNEDTSFSVENVIINDGDFVPTASLFVRKSVFYDGYTFRSIIPCDYSLQIQGALHGGMLYLNDAMAVYRLQTSGSWTTDMIKNKDKHIKHYDTIINMLDVFDKETSGKYSDIVEFQKNVYVFNKAVELDDRSLYREAKNVLCSKRLAHCYNAYLPYLKKRKYIKFHFMWLTRLRNFIYR